MVNPPTNETKMMNPPEDQAKMAKAAKVRIKALRDFEVEEKKGERRLIKAGAVVEVSPEVATEMCDKAFPSHYAFSGERYKSDGDTPMHMNYRAKRV